jgi:hypothetical protein
MLAISLTDLVAQPPTPRSVATVDFTGYWVSVVTEDWLYRMVTPTKGDYSSVPLNAAGRRLADGWDPAKDEASGNQCKAYGAPAVMRIPGRVHITWQDDSTLKVETDAGTQTRLFHFDAAKAGSGGDWQGVSVANWDVEPGARGPLPGAGLRVVTTHLKPGYLRKNGVPYSANTVVTEYYDRVNESKWRLVVDREDDRGRPGLLGRPVHYEHPFQEAGRFNRLESKAVCRAVKRFSGTRYTAGGRARTSAPDPGERPSVTVPSPPGPSSARAATGGSPLRGDDMTLAISVLMQYRSMALRF